MADVEPFLADIHSDVHSGLVHGILSLSYELKQLDGSGGIRQPLQPFSLLTTQGDDALAMGRLAEPGGERACRHRPGDDGHRLPGILFAFPCESAIPTPVEQEQGIVYQNRTRQGEGVSGGRGQSPCPPVLDVTPFPVGNNSMPPVASPRLGTSGCDYPGRIEFDKKRTGVIRPFPPSNIPAFLLL